MRLRRWRWRSSAVCGSGQSRRRRCPPLRSSHCCRLSAATLCALQGLSLGRSGPKKFTKLSRRRCSASDSLSLQPESFPKSEQPAGASASKAVPQSDAGKVARSIKRHDMPHGLNLQDMKGAIRVSQEYAPRNMETVQGSGWKREFR